MLQAYAKRWGVPSTRATDPSAVVSGASPTPMLTDTTAEEEEDAPDSATAAAKGWKGKGKQRAGKARRNPAAPRSQVSPTVACMLLSSEAPERGGVEAAGQLCALLLIASESTIGIRSR